MNKGMGKKQRDRKWTEGIKEVSEKKKQRKEERTYRDASVVPSLSSVFHLLHPYSDIPDASQLLALTESCRFYAKCENPTVFDPEVKSTK